MGRARSPKREEAKRLYLESKKNKSPKALKDIAAQLEVSESQLRKWKSLDNWDNKKQKKATKKPGGQKGNKNAVGHGAPKGNKSALKHGAYSRVFWDTLDAEEMDLIEDSESYYDVEINLLNEIKLLTVRERRIMKAINALRDKKKDMYTQEIILSEQKRRFDSTEDKELYKDRIAEKVENGERLPGNLYNVQTITTATYDQIARLEKELSTVQSAKTKNIEALDKHRNEKKRQDETEHGNDLVAAWAKSVMNSRGESNA